MLRDRDIICLGFPTWDGDYVKSTVMLMSELAVSNRVLYVDYQYTVKDIFTTLAGKQNAPIERMVVPGKGLRSVQTHRGSTVHVLTPPPVLPINWIGTERVHGFAMRLNARIVRQAVRRAASELSFTDPIVINAFNPVYGLPLIGAFEESLRIYYCYDDIGSAPWAKRHGMRMEREYVKRVDAVIASSRALMEDRSRTNPFTFLVQNGVDFDLFNSASIPSRTVRTTAPVAGYVGMIDSRLDYELLESAFKALPHMTFRFVGRATSPGYTHRLSKYPNVELLGAKQPAELPSLLRDMDVCIIPFIRNEFTRSIYPMKINEYLAAGKPVVLTEFADLREFGETSSIVQSPDEFISALRAAVAEDDERKRVARVEVARRSSWEQRAAAFSGIIEQVIRTRQNCGAFPS